MLLKKALKTKGWILFDESLLPLDCEAVPIPATLICLEDLVFWFCDCCAVEREQAPSPQ
jgi:hypothetical protein